MPSCGAAETHLFSSHPTTDASEASASRAWGPCRPISPKDPIKASHETRNRPEGFLVGRTMAGRPRALFATKRQKNVDPSKKIANNPKVFGIFAIPTVSEGLRDQRGRFCAKIPKIPALKKVK